MFRSKCKGETALWLSGEPRLGLPGDVRGMVVEDQLDGGIGRISGVKFLEKTNELPRAMAIFDRGVNLAREQVDPGEHAQRAMALVFMITRPNHELPPAMRPPVLNAYLDRFANEVQRFFPVPKGAVVESFNDLATRCPVFELLPLDETADGTKKASR
jgi:hypothetical protein